jgi:hypothetical protein
MGPGFTLLMRDPLSTVQVRELDAWLRTFTMMHQVCTNEAGDPDEWQFSVRDARALGLTYGMTSCLLGLSLIDPTREWDWGIEEQVMLRLGFWPRYGFNIWAGSKDFLFGRLMGHLILHLMERYAGFLDLCIHHEESKRPSPSVKDDSQAPGNMYTVSYWIADAGWHSREIIDAERLRWLLTDEHFVLSGFRMP